jgi:hypothetical protein
VFKSNNDLISQQKDHFLSILKSTKGNDFNGPVSGLLDGTPNERKSEMSIFDEA